MARWVRLEPSSGIRSCRVFLRIHADYARTLDIASLSSEAGMGSSAFHAHFKAVTSSPPLQYLKTLRLHKAQMDGAGRSQCQQRHAAGWL